MCFFIWLFKNKIIPLSKINKLFMKQLFTIIALLFLSFGYAQNGKTFTQIQMPLATDKDNLITSFELPIKQGTEIKELSFLFKSKKLNLSELSVCVGISYKNKKSFTFC